MSRPRSVLSCLLAALVGAALVLLTPLAPAGAAVDSIAALQAAIDAAPDDGTVVLDADIGDAGHAGLLLGSGSTVTLDLNGHTLSVQGPGGRAGIQITGATLVVTDSSAGHAGVLDATGGTGAAGIGGSAGADVPVPSYARRSATALTGTPAGGNGGNGGTLVIKGGTVIATGGTGGAGIGGGAGGTGGLGGIFLGSGGNGGNGGNGGVLSVEGGTVLGTGGNGGAGIGGGAGGQGGTGAFAEDGEAGTDGGDGGAGGSGGWIFGSGGSTTGSGGTGAAGFGGGAGGSGGNGGAGSPAGSGGNGGAGGAGGVLMGSGGTLGGSGGAGAPGIGGGTGGAGGNGGAGGGTGGTGGTGGPGGTGGSVATCGGQVTPPVGDPGSEAEPGVCRVVGFAPPTVDGAPVAYGTLSVTPGTWAPGDVSLGYQWLVDGDSVAGATATTYHVRPGDVGHRISVRVTASKESFVPAVAQAEASDVVAACTFQRLGDPAIVGSPAVGELLEARSGALTPEPEVLRYQWRADGDPIEGATGDRYRLTPADLGRRVDVTITATKPGCHDLTATPSPTAVVRQGTLHLVTPPTIVGDLVVGHDLTVAGGTWDVPPATIGYQWLRSGNPIAGATGASYSPAAADIGARLAVVLTAHAPGYADAAATAPATFPIAAGVGASVEPPIVSGTPRAGQVLTASPGQWSFPPDHVAFQWFAGSRAIAGATGDSLALVDPGLVGEQISVRVAASASGYPDADASSAPTSPVRRARVTLSKSLSTKTPQIRVDHVVVTLTVTAPDGLPVDGSARVLVDGAPVARGDLDAGGTVELTLPTFWAVGRHKVVVKYAGSELLAKRSSTTYVRATR